MSIRRRLVLAAAGLAVLGALLYVFIGAGTATMISVAPLGRGTSSLGAVWFVLALTNHSNCRVDVRVDWKQVVALPGGDPLTNSRWAEIFTMGPRAGTRMDFSPPRTLAPWTLRVRSQRFPGKGETWARA